MENLNNIEKITLLLSTCIVCLANLFVLIERIKKVESINITHIIQKLGLFKNTFFVLGIVVVVSSCSGSKFLNRKYTSGRFVENKKLLKHNTVYVDTTTKYTSANNQINLKKSNTIIDNSFDKKIIDVKVQSIIKKDSIWITKRKGRDKKIIKRDRFQDVIIAVNPEAYNIDNLPKLEKEYLKNIKSTVIRIKKKGKDLYISENGDTLAPSKLKTVYKIKDEKLKKLAIQSCNKISYKAMGWSILSFTGLILSITALHKIRKTKRKYENVNLKEARTIAFISLGISILTTICFLIITAFILYGLGPGIGAAATPAR